MEILKEVAPNARRVAAISIRSIFDDELTLRARRRSSTALS